MEVICITYFVITDKNIFEKKNECDVGLMIDRDVAEKRHENKVGLSSY